MTKKEYEHLLFVGDIIIDDSYKPKWYPVMYDGKAYTGCKHEAKDMEKILDDDIEVTSRIKPCLIVLYSDDMSDIIIGICNYENYDDEVTSGISEKSRKKYEKICIWSYSPIEKCRFIPITNLEYQYKKDIIDFLQQIDPKDHHFTYLLPSDPDYIKF